MRWPRFAEVCVFLACVLFLFPFVFLHETWLRHNENISSKNLQQFFFSFTSIELLQAKTFLNTYDLCEKRAKIKPINTKAHLWARKNLAKYKHQRQEEEEYSLMTSNVSTWRICAHIIIGSWTVDHKLFSNCLMRSLAHIFIEIIEIATRKFAKPKTNVRSTLVWSTRTINMHICMCLCNAHAHQIAFKQSKARQSQANLHYTQ